MPAHVADEFMVILKVGYLRARGDFGCRFLCGGKELFCHGLGRGGGGVRSALFQLAAVHAHADIVFTVEFDRADVDDELRGHWRMSFTGADLGAFYQKAALLSRSDSAIKPPVVTVQQAAAQGRVARPLSLPG